MIRKSVCIVLFAAIGLYSAVAQGGDCRTARDVIEKNLEAVGSSMAKVLKVNVYLNDLKDYKAMNEVFRGRFGATPGVRTTIAAAGGIPGDSLVEIDCIAHI